MRILFLTQVLPYPLDAGPKIRAYYTLRHLAKQHEVTLISFVRPNDSPEAVAHLQSICRAVYTVPMVRLTLQDVRHLLRSLPSRTPFLIARDWVPAMAERIQQVIESEGGFDAIHADQLWMAPYALWARERPLPGASNASSQSRRPQVVLDQHNAVFQIPRRLAEHEANPLKRALLTLEWRKMARYEKAICQRFDHVAWVTEEDRIALDRKVLTTAQPDNGNGNLTGSTVIPICADPAAVPVVQRVPGPHRVTFLGGMHWPPNAEGILWFARNIWPRVLEQAPNALLTVIGKDPPAELRQSGVEVTGFVEDLQPYLAETAVFIVPLHAGGGMRVKILDAWCWGLPVVSTQIGAEGLIVHDGKNMMVADTAETFAAAVIDLLNEPDLAARVSKAGRQTVEEFYNWRKVYSAWDNVYN